MIRNERRQHLFIWLFVLICLTQASHAIRIPENILENGDFELGAVAWHFWTHDDADATFHIEDNHDTAYFGEKVLHVKINKAGNQLFHIQLYQFPFTLHKWETYTYSLWAKSDKIRDVSMRVIHQGIPWNVYAEKRITLSPQWNEYFITFEMTLGIDRDARVDVMMGLETVDVWFDKIQLYEGEYVRDPLPVKPIKKISLTWSSLKSEGMEGIF